MESKTNLVLLRKWPLAQHLRGELDLDPEPQP